MSGFTQLTPEEAEAELKIIEGKLSPRPRDEIGEIISGDNKLTKEELAAKNAEYEKMLNDLLPPSPVIVVGGGSASDSSVYRLFGKNQVVMSPPPEGGGGMATNKKELDERIELDKRIELLHFLIDTFTEEGIMGKDSPTLAKFEEQCEKIFKYDLTTKSKNFINGIIKIIDNQILSNRDYVVIFTTLFENANNKLNKEKFGDTLTTILNSPKSMYEKFKALKEIYRIGKLIKGGKPHRTRRQKPRKSRRQKQRKSRRRL
jgi:hypothetical protein